MGANPQVAGKKNSDASDYDTVDGDVVVDIGPLSLLALRMRNTSNKSLSLS